MDEGGGALGVKGLEDKQGWREREAGGDTVEVIQCNSTTEEGHHGPVVERVLDLLDVYSIWSATPTTLTLYHGQQVDATVRGYTSATQSFY